MSLPYFHIFIAITESNALECPGEDRGTLGWPKMHQRWKTFRETCSTRVFFQVGEKNALKPAKNWWLGVAPGLAILSSIYLIDISEKWQILVEIIFDPSSCLENMNKHWETTWHIPKPHQGPKEHQNWALRSNFTNLEVTTNAWNWVWKIIFWLFSQFLPIFCIQWTQKPVETNLPIKIPHWEHKDYHFWPMGTGLRSGKVHIHEKCMKNHFFSFFLNSFQFFLSNGPSNL